jgi:hypothetical protein
VPASLDVPELVRQRATSNGSAGQRWLDDLPVAVWEWGFIERVSTGLANIREFEGGEGALFLEVATRCL